MVFTPENTCIHLTLNYNFTSLGFRRMTRRSDIDRFKQWHMYHIRWNYKVFQNVLNFTTSQTTANCSVTSPCHSSTFVFGGTFLFSFEKWRVIAYIHVCRVCLSTSQKRTLLPKKCNQRQHLFHTQNIKSWLFSYLIQASE